MGRIAAARVALLVFLALPPATHASDLVTLPRQPSGVPWPTDAWPEASLDPAVDRTDLDAAVASIFTAVGRGGVPDTRALLVVHRGAIVVERYASGFGPDSRFQSWSMAKSITQALVGILVRQGKLDVGAAADVPAWRADGDPRRAVTLDQLLHMTSGVANEDDLDDPADSVVTRMLFGDRSARMAEYAASLPLAHPPGSRWAYSTATSMIVADIVQRAAAGGKEAMLDFMRRELFDPLGMRSAVPEFDAGGTFMGGGFFHASARDYARFGYLYLRDGVWEGRRILPEGWVDYTRAAPPSGNYGAHFWLNLPPAERQYVLLPGGPPSAFGATGNEGQMIVVVPTHDLVAVRLGEMHACSWKTVTADLAAIVAAFAP
jgi:CubicO group peptidase (beta-lactamase class C family)